MRSMSMRDERGTAGTAAGSRPRSGYRSAPARAAGSRRPLPPPSSAPARWRTLVRHAVPSSFAAGPEAARTPHAPPVSLPSDISFLAPANRRVVRGPRLHEAPHSQPPPPRIVSLF